VIICRVVQLVLLRLLNNPTVMRGEAQTAIECWDGWRRIALDTLIQPLVFEPSGLDEILGSLMESQAHSPYLWTDAYLAAFAIAGGYTLVTFDRGFEQFEGLRVEVL